MGLRVQHHRRFGLYRRRRPSWSAACSLAHFPSRAPMELAAKDHREKLLSRTRASIPPPACCSSAGNSGQVAALEIGRSRSALDRVWVCLCPVWRRRNWHEDHWKWYRQLTRVAVAWRDRNAFGPNNIEHRSPLNDLRVIEFLAATPEWIKRFKGRPKDVLREAEYAVLPHTIPDRADCGFFDELVHAGVTVQELARVQRALGAIGSYPGVVHENLSKEVAQWLDDPEKPRSSAWHAITAGLWLDNVRNCAIV